MEQATFDPRNVPFPDSLSNSGGSAPAGREAFVACPTKWVNHHLRKLERTESIHLRAGGAFAKGMEVSRRTFFKEGQTAETARLAGMKALSEFYGDEYAELWKSEPKNRTAMLGALHSYQTRQWPFDSDYLSPYEDSTKGVEFDFALPIDVKHPTTGEPILYKGRLDWLARNRNDGQVWIVDDKTTSSLGQSWRKQWALDSQPTGYVWAARQFGIPAVGVIFRGTSILKPDPRSGDLRFGHEEALEQRTQFMLDDWYAQLCQDVEGMIRIWDDFRNGRRVSKVLDKSSCAAYGGCSYLQSCMSPNPEAYFQPPADVLAQPAPVDMEGLL